MIIALLKEQLTTNWHELSRIKAQVGGQSSEDRWRMTQDRGKRTENRRKKTGGRVRQADSWTVRSVCFPGHARSTDVPEEAGTEARPTLVGYKQFKTDIILSNQ